MVELLYKPEEPEDTSQDTEITTTVEIETGEKSKISKESAKQLVWLKNLIAIQILCCLHVIMMM